MRKSPLNFLILVSLALPSVLSASFALAADSDVSSLTEDQKVEKRLLFNQYVEEETARVALMKKSQEQTPAAPQKLWLARFSAVYGMDSNVNLDPSRKNDSFHQETLDVSYKKGYFGLTGHQDIFNYQRHSDLDYMITNAGIFAEFNINPKISFKMPYNFISTRYQNNDQLSFDDHQFKPTLTHAITERLSQYVYLQFDIRSFWDRKKQEADGSLSIHNREDLYYEPGYGLRYFPTDKLFLGATAAWKRNDSDGEFNDFDDYKGYKVNGYFYYHWIERVSLMGFGGYDRKNYDSRTFSNHESGVDTESDDFFYAGSYLFYDITKRLQANVAYLYKQNYSNDPAREFSGYTWSGGLSLAF